MATEDKAADAGYGAEASSAGMPQLDFSTWDNQMFWLVIALLATYFILSRVALPRIGGILAERAGTISNDIAAAEDLKAKATEAEAAYEKALVDARAEAGRIVAEAKAEIQKDLDEATAKADAEISAKAAESEAAIAEIRKGAMESVEVVAKETADAIIEAVMPGTGSAKAISDAVKSQMKGV